MRQPAASAARSSPSLMRRGGFDTERVEHLEAGVDVALGGLAAGGLDGECRDVDAEGAGAQARSEDRVLAGAAAGVEECTGQRTDLGEADKGGLWAADVPRGQRACVGAIPVVGGVGRSHVRILVRRANSASATARNNLEEGRGQGVGDESTIGREWHAPAKNQEFV